MSPYLTRRRKNERTQSNYRCSDRSWFRGLLRTDLRGTSECRKTGPCGQCNGKSSEFHELVLDIQNEYSDEKAKAIDQRIFDLYGLTQEERDAIGYIDFHNDNNDEFDDDE